MRRSAAKGAGPDWPAKGFQGAIAKPPGGSGGSRTDRECPAKGFQGAIAKPPR